MSKGFLHRFVSNAWIWSAVVAALPAMACAGVPRAPQDSNTPAVRNRTAARASTQPAPRLTARPGVRTPASFTPEMPLSEAIDILRNCTTPPLNIIVLWRDLDSAGIYRDTAIGIDGLPGLRVSQYLDLLVLSLSAGAADKIGYAVHGGVITIATTRALPAPKAITRVYDISDLTAPPSNPALSMGFGGMGYGGMGYGGMYGNQMMGLSGGYGGGLGTGYGLGSSSLPGGLNGARGSGGLPGLVGNSYGRIRAR